VWIFSLLAITSTVLITSSTTFGFPLPFAREIYAELDEPAFYKEIQFFPLSIVALCIISMLIGALACRIWDRHSTISAQSKK